MIENLQSASLSLLLTHLYNVDCMKNKRAKGQAVSLPLPAFISLHIECYSDNYYNLMECAGMKCSRTLFKNIARHSLCDAWELNRFILGWKDIAVSHKARAGIIAQYNSRLCLSGSSFFFFFFTFEQRQSGCANKILWNHTKFVLVWQFGEVLEGFYSGPVHGMGIFWQWGVAGSESPLHLQDSIAVFTRTVLKIFRYKTINWSRNRDAPIRVFQSRYRNLGVGR